MKIVTERELRRTIAERWPLEQYPPGSAKVADQLRALGDNPTLEQIAEVIGATKADLWTEVDCYECERHVPAAVEFLADTYDNTVICLDCLQEAVKRLQGHRDE